MNWPALKGTYRIINPEGDIAVLSRASLELPKNESFNNSSRICIIGSCVTENVGLDKLITNIVTNPRIRHIIICGRESKGHNVGDALIKLKEKGIDNNQRIIDATGDDARLKIPKKMIEHFRKQIRIILLETENPLDIIKKADELILEESFEEYDYQPEKLRTRMPENSIRADEEETKYVQDPKGYFTINLDAGNIIVKHFVNEQLKNTIIGRTAEALTKKINDLNLVSRIDHALYLGKELKKAENALNKKLDYEQDLIIKQEKYLKPVLIEAKNLADSWIKALSACYEGEEYLVKKYADVMTHDLPIIIHVENALEQPLIHPKAPKANAVDKYAKEFLEGKGKDKENEFVYTYYSRLRHHLDCPKRARLQNIMNEKELEKAREEKCDIICYDQIKEAVKQLKKDPSSRRCDIVTWMPYKDLSMERGSHAPCLVLIQPRINKEKLDFFVIFKSQDLYGGYPSNAYALVKLQAEIAKELGISIGSYTHYTISMHFYDEVIDEVKTLLREEGYLE